MFAFLHSNMSVFDTLISHDYSYMTLFKIECIQTKGLGVNKIYQLLIKLDILKL